MKAGIFVLITIFSVSSFSADLSYPKLFFSYSRLYDGVCSQAPGKTVNPEWAEEADAKTQDFETMWLGEAPSMMGKLFELFGMGFQRKEWAINLSGKDINLPIKSITNCYILGFEKTYLGRALSMRNIIVSPQSCETIFI